MKAELAKSMKLWQSAHGEASEDFRPRARRGLPLFHARRSGAARRHRLGEKPPRRDGPGGHRWSARRGGGGSRLGAPRAARCAGDRSRGRGNSGKLRALRDAADRVGAGREKTAPASPAWSFTRYLIALAGLLAGLRGGGFGGRAPAFLHAGGEGALAGGRILTSGDSLVGVIARRDCEREDDEHAEGAQAALRSAHHPALRR